MVNKIIVIKSAIIRATASNRKVQPYRTIHNLRYHDINQAKYYRRKLLAAVTSFVHAAAETSKQLLYTFRQA